VNRVGGRFLSRKEEFDLVSLLKAEFVGKKLTDADFAKYATEKLGFDVNSDHVSNNRRAFGIPSTKQTVRAEKKAAAPGTVVARIAGLEARVEALESAVLKLLDRTGGRQ
jgi:hypothetical protein